MRKAVAVLAILALACSPAQTNLQPMQVSLTGQCPKQSDCTVKLLPNKGMVIEPTNNGVRYTSSDQPGTHVIVYQYNKIVKANLQDASYREEIVFEYDGRRGYTLTDFDLQKTKMLFGRFCYCEGQTGYFPIRQGRLSIDQDASAKLDFTIAEVPQITKEIQFFIQ